MAGSSLRRLMAEYKRKYMHISLIHYLFKATSNRLSFDINCVGYNIGLTIATTATATATPTKQLPIFKI